MKYLNKIIFINSANIPYAEISVDGNVHFTGTQGVGKSTVMGHRTKRILRVGRKRHQTY